MDRARPALLLSLLLGSACEVTPECGDFDNPCDDQVLLDNEGEACIVDLQTAPYGTGVSIHEGEAVVVRVAFGECMPCSDDLQSQCTVSRDGQRLVVEAASLYTPSEGDCTAECKAWFAECTSESLEAGSYQLSFGADQAAFEVPSSGALVCAVGG